jgi:hypothetical protein
LNRGLIRFLSILALLGTGAPAATVDPDRILLSAGTYTLTIPGTSENLAATGDLDVTRDLEIVGPGAPFSIIDGGGLDRVFDVGNDAELTLRGLTVRGAAASTMGVLVQPGESLVVEDCEIRDNGGSGIQAGSGSSVVIRRTTIAHNTANGLIQVSPGSAHLENVTISENGGTELSIQNGPTLRCDHCTIQDLDDSGDELHSSSPAVVTMSNSIVLGSCGATDATLVSEGGNVESPGNTCHFDQASDQHLIADADVGALGDEGGPTPTHLPEAGSEAVAGGLDAGCLGPTDQRGAERPETDCDSGAVQAGAARPATPLFADGFEQGNRGAWLTN